MKRIENRMEWMEGDFKRYVVKRHVAGTSVGYTLYAEKAFVVACPGNTNRLVVAQHLRDMRKAVKERAVTLERAQRNLYPR